MVGGSAGRPRISIAEDRFHPDFYPLVRDSKSVENSACGFCVHLSGDHRDLQCCQVSQPAVHVVGDVARQRAGEPVPARDPAGMLSAHLHNFSHRGAGRVSRKWWRAAAEWGRR